MLLPIFFALVRGQDEPPQEPPAPRCDPFYEVCPEYVSGEAECNPIGQAGRLLVLSPNPNAYYYIGVPINITISYTRETSPEFPRESVVMYYRNQGNEQWTQWVSIPRGERTVLDTLNNVIPGAYEV
jgi:hypothetical protein